MIDGHIDPDKNEMTPKKAYKILKDTPIRAKGNHAEYSKALHLAMAALEKQIPKKPMTQFEKLKQMNTDEAAAFISALADSCKDVARYGNQTVPYLVKLLLECEVEEE